MPKLIFRLDKQLLGIKAFVVCLSLLTTGAVPLVSLADVTPGPSTTNPFSRIVDNLHAKNVPASAVLTKLGKSCGVDVTCEQAADNIPVTIDLTDIPAEQAFGQVLARSNLGAVTTGVRMFVLRQPIDRITVEATALDMPVDDNKPQSPELRSVMEKSQQAYVAKDYPKSEQYLRQALDLAYGVNNQQGALFEIVQRFQQMYAKQGIGPEEALQKLKPDPYISALLLRFYRRQSIQDGNFDTFEQSMALLRQVMHNQALAHQSKSSDAKSMSLDELEESLLGTTYPDDSDNERLSRLEKMMFGQPADPHKHTEAQRTAALSSAMGPAAQPASSNGPGAPIKGNWFTNPPPITWLNKLGNGAKQTAKTLAKAPLAAAEGVDKVISSPLFWEAALGAGVVTGLYFANRGLQSGMTNPEHACTGNKYCTACSSCNYCANCNIAGTRRCIHFYLYRGWSSPY